MNEILDNEEIDDQRINKTLTSNIGVRSIIYFLVMLIGGMLYMKLISQYKPTLYNLLYGSLIFIMMFIVLGALIVMIQFFIRKRKEAKTGIKLKYDPIWFQILEHGFVWWLIIMVIIVVGNYV